MTYYKELGRKLGQHHKEIKEKVENESVKRKSLAAIKEDYIDFVVPLCSLDNTDANSNFYFSGNIFLKRYNMASQMASIEITCGKMYNATLPYCFMASNDIKVDILVRPITFTYNDIQYFGLYFSGVETYFSEGYARGEAADWSIVDCISVYNNSTQTVLNEEIYNSIAYTSEEQQLPKEFYTTPQVHLNGAGDVYKLLSEADVDTTPTSGSNNPVSSDGVYKAIQSIDTGNIIIDSELSSTSTNSVQNKVITAELNEITNKLNDTDNLVQSWYDSSVIGDGVIPSIINMGELSQFHDKVDNVLFNGGTYGVCDTAFNTATKTVTIAEWTEKPGAVIYVKFTNGISMNHNITLSINNGTAYSVLINGCDSTSSLNTNITNGTIIQLVFDGNNFIAYNLMPDNAYYANWAWNTESMTVNDWTDYPEHGGRYLAFAQDYGTDYVAFGVHPYVELNEDNALTCDITGNAGTATAFEESQSVALTGDVTGSASSQAGWSVTTTLANSGVTAGSYGPSSNASPAHSGTFSVPYITVDAKGRVTSASTKTITLPSDNNTDTDIRNTAGSTDSSSKLYIVGAASQAASPQTYSHDTVYIGTDGHVYSNSKQTVNLSDSQALTNKTYNGYTLGAACAKGVTDSTSNGAFSSSGTSLVTERDVYYGLPKINNSNTYNRGTSIYAPTAGGTAGYYLKGNGTTSAPVWQSYSTTPTSGSTTLITSGGVYTALQDRMLVGTDVYDAGNGVKNTTINSTNYPGIKSFRFAPMEYAGLAINCSTSCEFIGTGDIDNHYYNYTGTSYDTKTKFTNSTIKASASVTFRGILFQNTYGNSIISETSYTTDVRYQFIDCDFCISEASDYYPLFVLKNSSIEFINCRFYLNTNTTGPCYHIVDSSYNNTGTTTIKLINSIVNYSSSSNEDTVFATTNGGATKVIIENSFINNGNPIKPTANFNDGFGITISNSELRDCNIIGSQTSYTGLTKGHFVINNCRFTGTQSSHIYTSGNLVNISNNTFENSSNILLHGEYNVFANNMSDSTISLYEYANTKGTITGNTASAITQPVSATTYTKTGNYPSIT